MASNPVSNLTEEQYLAIERAAEFKSEFLDGVMYAMSGGSLRHSDLASNVLAQLRAMLRSSECKAFNSDLRVRVSARMYAYPDVSVVCGKPLLADDHQDILFNPIVIVEVLSPSTEQYDRGMKFQLYRTIESLREYILVDQDKVLIEQYIRQDASTWTLRDHQTLEDELKMDSIGVSLPLRLIYDRVDLLPPSGRVPAPADRDQEM
jgi:Uma2 family endonuclease